MKPKFRMIDLFAGCGGLEDGFLQTGRFKDIAAVEWLEPQVVTLASRLKDKWGVEDASDRVMRFDIQREKELFGGWQSDPEFGTGKGLDYYVEKAKGIDVIIGGPPCQAYSLAGRVRDENGMKNDYRNYLFEHYLNVVNRYKPQLFVFENVPGILSAVPDGTHITDRIHQGFESIGYTIIDDISKFACVNAADFGVPQVRKRVIIIGLKKGFCETPQQTLVDFYTNILSKYKTKKVRTVREAIGDLPKCIPSQSVSGKKVSHITPACNISWHRPRFHNQRDMDIFNMLAKDIETKEYKYIDRQVLSKIYEEKVGSVSPIHRYHVLREDEPSTTIIAHLYKDGNRYIHYDSQQCRTITPREAARLQSFDDDFEFFGSQGNVYQMIGNAVPPLLAKSIAMAVCELLDINKGENKL